MCTRSICSYLKLAPSMSWTVGMSISAACIGCTSLVLFFVTRAKSNLNAHRVYSAGTDRTTGVIADQTIALDGHYTSQDYPVHLRRVRFRDEKTGKTLVFLTNQTALPALTICDLYKSRW